LLPFGFLLGFELGDGFFPASEMETSGDDFSDSQSILIEGTDFPSAVFEDDELLDLFQSLSDDEETTSQSISPPPTTSTSPLQQMYSIQLSSPTTSHSTSPSSSITTTSDYHQFIPYCPKKAYRQGAIARWLHKRQRRTFSKKVLVPSVKSQKLVPKRSSSNGRFVKSTTGFVSITALQNLPSDTDSD
jgi:hypothetical protein